MHRTKTKSATGASADPAVEFAAGDRVRWRHGRAPRFMPGDLTGRVADTPRNGITVYVDWGGAHGTTPVAATAIEKA